VNLIKIPQILKFYRHLKQQGERNCWWNISTARQSLELVLGRCRRLP